MYIRIKKARNHKSRETWASVLNKLSEHTINLGQSLETSWRDNEGTSIIFTSDGHTGPASGNFDTESNKKIANRLELSQRQHKINNQKKQANENEMIRANIGRLQQEFKEPSGAELYKKLENDYEKKKNFVDMILMVYPLPNQYVPDNNGKMVIKGDDKRFDKKSTYTKLWLEGKKTNDLLPPNVRIYKLSEFGINLDIDEPQEGQIQNREATEKISIKSRTIKKQNKSSKKPNTPTKNVENCIVKKNKKNKFGLTLPSLESYQNKQRSSQNDDLIHNNENHHNSLNIHDYGHANRNRTNSHNGPIESAPLIIKKPDQILSLLTCKPLDENQNSIVSNSTFKDETKYNINTYFFSLNNLDSMSLCHNNR